MITPMSEGRHVAEPDRALSPRVKNMVSFRPPIRAGGGAGDRSLVRVELGRGRRHDVEIRRRQLDRSGGLGEHLRIARTDQLGQAETEGSFHGFSSEVTTQASLPLRKCLARSYHCGLESKVPIHDTTIQQYVSQTLRVNQISGVPREIDEIHISHGVYY